jgi:hypothetical protein
MDIQTFERSDEDTGGTSDLMRSAMPVSGLAAERHAGLRAAAARQDGAGVAMLADLQ